MEVQPQVREWWTLLHLFLIYLQPLQRLASFQKPVSLFNYSNHVAPIILLVISVDNDDGQTGEMYS